MAPERAFVLAVDQSTQGTKAVLFDGGGRAVAKVSRPHDQIVNAKGWVSHDPEQIVTNVLAACRDVCKGAGVRQGEVACVGISNQRETCMAWDTVERVPLANAIVWQCGRATSLADALRGGDPAGAERVRELSGMPLSPYFSAAKMAWLLENVPGVDEASRDGRLALGTMDSWLVFCLTQEHSLLTEPSNACRTQLLDLRRARWSEELCDFFGVPIGALPRVVPSDSCFGHTVLGGLFDEPVPVCGVLGDSQAALAAQDCLEPGDLKATYGTGSSVMMQVGPEPVESGHGLVSSIAWDFSGVRSYVLEGNLNYTGATVSWLKDSMGLIDDPSQVEEAVARANPRDRAYFVPAFTGLGAPWWDSDATGLLTGITRTTGRDEMVKACAESIPYQISSVVEALRADTGVTVGELRADGGATGNAYLMGLQADLADLTVSVSSLAELSAGGAAFVAGRSAGVYEGNEVFRQVEHRHFEPTMDLREREERLAGWEHALRQAMTG